MRGFLLAAIGLALVSPTAFADGTNLAGSLWHCTRATDQSQFVITFYPGGGVGGGEFQNGEVSPYIFDASRTKPGEWPGRWDQTGRRFTWTFPDQSIRIEGSLTGLGQTTMRLAGTETSLVGRSAVTCTALTKLPTIGAGLVIPRDSRFIDLDGEEGELKVPAGVSLQEQGSR
ncbi:hypothetical protein ILT44_30175 [Microvirga sp. BT689]|uniref:hypothetical protein n=1 Tax=Microvirga arvi TaxID=2778731 RepID=UPI001951DFED|nr:hypothetical protein [Microvirga arvi]MBM6584460.1 hypothetical protein [Microvirga arvi]